MGLVFIAISACSATEPRGSAPAPAPPGEPSGEETMLIKEKGKMAQPVYTNVRYHANGTLSEMNGENLALSLETQPGYQSALKNLDYENMVFGFLDHYQTIFRMDSPRTEFQVEYIRSDALGSTHVQLNQQLNQVPVRDKAIRVHFNEQHALYMVQGDYLPVDTLKKVPTDPRLSATEAADIAIDAASDAPGQWRVQGNTLIIYTQEDRTPHLAYEITMAKGLTGRDQYIIDAQNGNILERTTLIRP